MTRCVAALAVVVLRAGAMGGMPFAALRMALPTIAVAALLAVMATV